MDDKPRERPEWKHDGEVSLRGAVPALRSIREALEKALEAEKAKLRDLVEARDSLKK